MKKASEIPNTIANWKHADGQLLRADEQIEKDEKWCDTLLKDENELP